MSRITDLIAELKAMDPTPKRTQYGILLRSGLWAGENYKWVDSRAHAKRFEFATSATVRAIMVLNLSVNDFTVEAL